MSTKKACGLLLLVACLLSPLAVPWVGAQLAPSIINYQGQLYDPSANGGAGGPLTGLQQVEFRVWDNASGGTLIWGRQFPVDCNAQGIFNVLLSDGGTLLPNVQTNNIVAAFNAANRFLELTVQGHGTAISPRQQLASAPYALQSENANNASMASGGFDVYGGLEVLSGGANITGNAGVSGALTAGGNLTVASPSTINGYGTIPVGGIIMWSGGTVPDGWALCDGQTHNNQLTPDLRDRFIVGAGNSYTIGNAGGTNTYKLSTAQLPAHGHTYKDGYYVEAYAPKTGVTGGGFDSYSYKLTGSDGTDNDNTNIYWRAMTTDNIGSNSTIENRPLYYALAYIMRVK